MNPFINGTSFMQLNPCRRSEISLYTSTVHFIDSDTIEIPLTYVSGPKLLLLNNTSFSCIEPVSIVVTLKDFITGDSLCVYSNIVDNTNTIVAGTGQIIEVSTDAVSFPSVLNNLSTYTLKGRLTDFSGDHLVGTDIVATITITIRF